MDGFVEDLVARRLHREQSARIDSLLRSGALVRMLPGVHRRREVEETFPLRIAAIALWQPDAIILGAAAARCVWWPEREVERIDVACRNPRALAPWLRARRRTVPLELVREQDGIRVAGVEHSILDLSAQGDENAICEGLRRGVTSVERLERAAARLPAGERGARTRSTLLKDSRDSPWSPLERRAHAQLRDAGITGWRANLRVEVNGRTYFLDAGFPAELIAVECDGWAHHGPDRREQDLERRNALVAAGWTVFNFTWRTVGGLVETIAPVLRERRSHWIRRHPDSILPRETPRRALTSVEDSDVVA